MKEREAAQRREYMTSLLRSIDPVRKREEARRAGYAAVKVSIWAVMVVVFAWFGCVMALFAGKECVVSALVVVVFGCIATWL